MNNEKNKVNQDDEISLKELFLKIADWWSFLWSKKWIIVVVGLLGGILGLGYSLIKKPVYTATTSFVLESGEKSGIGQYAGLASMIGLDLGGGGGGIFQGDNILELYKSRTVIENTLFSTVTYDGKKEILINHYINFNELREGWESKPHLKNLSFVDKGNLTRVQDSIVGLIVNDIRQNYLNAMRFDKKLGILTVSITSTNEFFAKEFNDAIVKNVNDFYIDTKTRKAKDNVAILQRKADSVRSVMDGNIYKAVAIADATPNSNPTRQVLRVAPAQKAQYAAEANKTVLSLLIQNLEMSKMALMKETPLIQPIDTPKFPLEKKRLGKIKPTFLGGVFAGFLIVLFLTVKRSLKILLA